MPDHRPPLAETLLARLTDPIRAAAIYGDLAEISATRGRRWFWTAYARTLITLGWRAPVAFLCAYAFATWVAVGAFPTIRGLLLRSFYRDARPRGAFWHVFDRAAHHGGTHGIWQIPLGDSLIALWFILPFVVIRFGLRDRLTQLAAFLFLLTLPYFSLDAAGVNLAGFLTAAILIAALILPAWRRPIVVLAASVAPITTAIFFSPKFWFVFISHGYSYGSPQLQHAMQFYRAAELCTATIVCSFLHGRLLPEKSTDRKTIA